MKTVRDIYLDALAMKRDGLDALTIASRLVDIGYHNGFTSIHERRSPQLVELTFEKTGEIIRFDGTDWHHVRP